MPLSLGTYARGDGVNVAFFSRHASRVRLELFDHPEDATAARLTELDPARNRTGDVWHVWIQGICAGQLYAYRVDGPYQPNDGHRFNFNKLLLDPFATAISPLLDWDFGPARGDETHVRDFTIHPSSSVEHPVTYRGLMEKIPCFTKLGITTVELMPAQGFNEHQVIGFNPHTGGPLNN